MAAVFGVKRKVPLKLSVATPTNGDSGGVDVPTGKRCHSKRTRDELRRDLLLIRAAIHRYKEAADQGAFQIKVGSEGYPPNLDTLVTGVATDSGKKLTFLRGIPVDPIAKQEWGVRSSKNTSSWGGQNVFDVFCKSDQVAVDGTKYKDW